MKTFNNYQLEIAKELEIEACGDKEKFYKDEFMIEEYEAIESARAEEQEKKEREEQKFFELLNEKRRMSAEELIELNTEKGEF